MKILKRLKRVTSDQSWFKQKFLYWEHTATQKDAMDINVLKLVINSMLSISSTKIPLCGGINIKKSIQFGKSCKKIYHNSCNISSIWKTIFRCWQYCLQEKSAFRSRKCESTCVYVWKSGICKIRQGFLSLKINSTLTQLNLEGILFWNPFSQLETGNDIKNEGVLFLLECFKNNTSLILLTFGGKLSFIWDTFSYLKTGRNIADSFITWRKTEK